ncbi:Hsp20/alpha crystallin family protein [Feifania hominis]|uniref:Hsp20/alpha crystallin family protein n=1 Tax=Feifania hominis TaxID=2763660 RepID=A0A926DF57_9FIRM|nr:Hsp20/alpha crystallin family protein [Feifania hominis]MBC8537061.1 Hsp20/alpha crystallin family protein [Feifania hominis]
MFELMPFGRRSNSLSRYFDEMEKNFFGDSKTSLCECRTDILDQGDHYLLKAELPGFRKEDVKVDLGDGVLTIRAEHSEQSSSGEGENYIRREMHYGAYERSFGTEGIDVGRIEAKYENGILELTLPKEAPAKQEVTRRIEIK